MVELDMIDTTGTDFPKGKKEKEVPQLRSNVQQIQYQELPEPKATDNLGIPEATPISAREAIKYQPQQTANAVEEQVKSETTPGTIPGPYGPVDIVSLRTSKAQKELAEAERIKNESETKAEKGRLEVEKERLELQKKEAEILAKNSPEAQRLSKLQKER